MNAPVPGSRPEKIHKPKKRIQVSRVLGYGFLIVGLVSIIDFFSPIPIPTTATSAILSGLFFTAAGSFLLVRNKMERFKKLLARLGGPGRASRPAAPLDPLIPVKILKLAQAHRGILTQAQVAVELTLSLSEAEAGLEECVRGGLAAADFDMEKQIKYYRFQEFVPPSPPAQPLPE